MIIEENEEKGYIITWGSKNNDSPRTTITQADDYGNLLEAEVELDKGYYYGSVTNLKQFKEYENLGVLAFGGTTLEAAQVDFKESIDEFHEWVAKTKPKLNA